MNTQANIKIVIKKYMIIFLIKFLVFINISFIKKLLKKYKKYLKKLNAPTINY
jgi:hypothetical protein